MTDRRFIANNYQDKSYFIHAAETSYLRRNLRIALDREQHNLLLEQGHDPPSKLIGSSNNGRLPSWHFPPTNMFNGLTKGLAPVVCVEKMIMRHANCAKVKPIDHAKRRVTATSPDWLPAQDQWKVPCQVSVRVVYLREPRRMIYHSVKEGHVLRHDHPTRDSAFEVVVESPFEIELAKFEVMVEYKDKNGKTQWKLGRDDDQCSIEMHVECNSSADTKDLLSQLENQDVSEYADIPSIEGRLRCSWNGLPNLPVSGKLLDLRRSQRKKLRDMRYNAELVMDWSSEMQPLAAYNRAWQVKQDHARHLPTPSISDDLEKPRKMRVHYMKRGGGFQGEGAVNAGLHCVLSSCYHRAEHSSLERLMLHYAIHHDQMKFEIDTEHSDRDLVVIFVNSAEDIAANISRRKQGFEWQRPEAAFDILAHLKGTTPWAITHIDEKSGNATPQRSPRKKVMAGLAPRPLPFPTLPGRSRKTIIKPEDVPNMPVLPRRKHKVPQVENISFYRSLSKQVVPAGEEISDSEAETDMEWARQSQRAEQTALGIDRATQDFNEMLNRHLDKEQPMSDHFMREAIVRFARSHAPQLSQWRDQFKAKLDQFEATKIINSSISAYCMGLLTVPAQPEPELQTLREITPNSRSSQALSGMGRFFRRGEDSTSRTPDRGRAMSPPSHISTKSRMRWRDGRISQEERDAASGSHEAPNRAASGSPTPKPRQRPFGRRRVICRRGGEPGAIFHVFDFLRDNLQHVPYDDIEIKDLDISKLERILNEDLRLKVEREAVWLCKSLSSQRLDDLDYLKALKQIKNSGRSEEIIFEIRRRAPAEMDLLSQKNPVNGTSNNTAKRKRIDGASPSRKKAKVQETQVCVCGSTAQGMRGTLACGNPQCPRFFHLRCLNLQHRPSGEWLCVDCR